MNQYTPEQREALRIAHTLADMGAPIFAAARNSGAPGEFLLPSAWPTFRPQFAHAQIDKWRPGMGLAMVCGVTHDVIDVDPRNGGSLDELRDALGGALPLFYGHASTPSAGDHYLIASTGMTKGKLTTGIDHQAGDRRGQGRGFVWLAPTERPSKHGARKGEVVAYEWATEPAAVPDSCDDPGHAALCDFRDQARGQRMPILAAGAPRESDPDDPFDGAQEVWTPVTAGRVISGQLGAVAAARDGAVNDTLGGAARVLGRFVAGGFLAEDRAVEMLQDALAAGGVHSDSWNVANGKSWTARTVIGAAFARSAAEPWNVGAAPTVPPTPASAPTVPAASEPTSGAVPPLLVESSAIMAYWLQQELGRGRLAGFFSRNGQVVHTPRVGEEGYVPPRSEADDNGPAEIRPVTADTLAAKIQYLYRCEKLEKRKGEDPARVPAMFPKMAASTAVNAPEAMQGLRGLAGITLTPMMRADGTVLDRPGYDASSGYLFLPGPGVKVAPVPGEPTPLERQVALEWLTDMVADFPFGTDEDRANYLGMLLTPLLRQMAPPSYKLFGIGAHQPGSGKSLLAWIASQVHGGVLRSEVPQDEAEWSKQTASILTSTAAPVVVLDNVSGVLKSSALAGLLTATGEMTQRELGKSTDLRFVNDRVWCVTGNNLSLGGDLVRRTIIINIDPDMANPETRTAFKIPNLTAWVNEHRNEILWSLLVLIRAWVAAGRPTPERKQSDSFAAWEAMVGGILAHAGVPGGFDQESGKRAAAGGDDDGLADLLSRLHEIYEDKPFTVAGVLGRQDVAGFVADRDWLPALVLEKIARSGEGAAKNTFGKWLRFRLGRWVAGQDGVYVLRAGARDRAGQWWKVERRD